MSRLHDQIPDQASRRVPCASAFLTSDCANCLAIAAGLTPALKAARTAFSLPVVNECAPSSGTAEGPAAEPKIGLGLSPQAAGLACPNYAAGG